MKSSEGRIPYVNLQKQWLEERNDLLPIIDKVFESAQFIGGDQLDRFEKSIAKLCGTKYACGLNSGTDALMLALSLSGIGKGDEVITPPNSFIASTAAIVHIGATPVFVDVLPDQNIDPSKIEAAITEKTKAIMPVHLTGRMCDMDPIINIAMKNNLKVIEDAAQSVGSKYKGRLSGSIGDIGCFSTHPLKNLNACGDGGFLTTDDEVIYNKARSYRNHGMVNRNIVDHFGSVTRMDNLQASILNYRLDKLKAVTKKRRVNAKLYMDNIHNQDIVISGEKNSEYNVYHTFVIQSKFRDELKEYLSNNGIDTAIHYPVPIHLQPAAKKLGYKVGDFPVTEKQSKEILTLPVNQYLEKIDLKRIISVINQFKSKALRNEK
jgi:dTDP-4-amino-4,6-dideoxygalactose transaminase